MKPRLIIATFLTTVFVGGGLLDRSHLSQGGTGFWGVFRGLSEDGMTKKYRSIIYDAKLTADRSLREESGYSGEKPTSTEEVFLVSWKWHWFNLLGVLAIVFFLPKMFELISKKDEDAP